MKSTLVALALLGSFLGSSYAVAGCVWGQKWRQTSHCYVDEDRKSCMPQFPDCTAETQTSTTLSTVVCRWVDSRTEVCTATMGCYYRYCRDDL
jgi:hypothetical protein